MLGYKKDVFQLLKNVSVNTSEFYYRSMGGLFFLCYNWKGMAERRLN